VRDDADAAGAASQLARELNAADVRTKLDAQTGTSFGRRLTDWELKGVPVRVEIGPRELAEGNVTIARRDTGQKYVVALSSAVASVIELLEEIQVAMLTAAIEEQRARTADVTTVADATDAAEAGFARLPFDLLDDGVEAELAKSAITVRCIQRADGTVPLSEDEPDLFAVVARAY
jgi:prolyl-tRNA synthetase